jgi:hypothetical protein
MGSTHSVDMKYIGLNLGSAKSPRRVAKNDRIICQIYEVRLVTLGSTHGDCKKYKYSFFGSATFTISARKLMKSSRGKYKTMRVRSI